MNGRCAESGSGLRTKLMEILTSVSYKKTTCFFGLLICFIRIDIGDGVYLNKVAQFEPKRGDRESRDGFRASGITRRVNFQFLRLFSV